jgi:hypothetical protein
MPKTKSTRAIARKHTLADRLDEIKRDLIGARASVMTTQALLRFRGGIDQDVAINLMRGAILPIGSALALVTALQSLRAQS